MGCGPTQEELRQAFQAGFQSIDEGRHSIRAFRRFWSPSAIARRKVSGARAGMVVRMATCRSVGG
jgi:hypothetical protein